ncbi:MAG: hypothetical protein QME64_11330, partial [bacterium]|nr:hypothetical protein [bacterium]
NDQRNQIGNMLIRAKYGGNPPTITIYRKTIQQLLEPLPSQGCHSRESGNKFSLTLKQLEEMAITHELYHHLEMNKPKKGDFPNLTRLFEELAAHSFTQGILGLVFFPLIIDFTDNKI